MSSYQRRIRRRRVSTSRLSALAIKIRSLTWTARRPCSMLTTCARVQPSRLASSSCVKSESLREAAITATTARFQRSRDFCFAVRALSESKTSAPDILRALYLHNPFSPQQLCTLEERFVSYRTSRYILTPSLTQVGLGVRVDGRLSRAPQISRGAELPTARLEGPFSS